MLQVFPERLPLSSSYTIMLVFVHGEVSFNYIAPCRVVHGSGSSMSLVWSGWVAILLPGGFGRVGSAESAIFFHNKFLSQRDMSVLSRSISLTNSCNVSAKINT